MSQDFVETVRIENFGCVRDAQLELTRLHALIGPNDSGKSTVLAAIRTMCELIRWGEPQLRNEGRLDLRGVTGSKITMGWRNTAVACMQQDNWLFAPAAHLPSLAGRQVFCRAPFNSRRRLQHMEQTSCAGIPTRFDDPAS